MSWLLTGHLWQSVELKHGFLGNFIKKMFILYKRDKQGFINIIYFQRSDRVVLLCFVMVVLWRSWTP